MTRLLLPLCALVLIGAGCEAQPQHPGCAEWTTGHVVYSIDDHGKEHSTQLSGRCTKYAE